MVVLVILVLLGAVVLWFLLSPLFGKIGDSVSKKSQKMFSDDEDKNTGEEGEEHEYWIKYNINITLWN